MEMMHKLMQTANVIQNKHYFTVQDDDFFNFMCILIKIECK